MDLGPLSSGPLIFGGAPIGGLYSPVSDEAAAGTLAAAWAAGIRAFDTAPHARGMVRAIGAGMNAAAPLAWLTERGDLDCVLVAGATPAR